jgi:hypothetical protein
MKAFSGWMWIGAASGMFWVGIAGSALAQVYDGVAAVPELDPGTMTSGLALLIGGGLLLLERYRRS